MASMHPLLIRQPVLTCITANIGAQIDGLDLTRRLRHTEVDLLRSAIAEHLVVILRSQFLSASQLADVAESFAPILHSPVHAITGDQRKVSTIEDTATRPPAGFPWHSDLSWMRHGPVLGFLSAVSVPDVGGDTLWASTASVYDRLTEHERLRCDSLTAVHEPDDSLLASITQHHGRSVADQLRASHPPLERPLVRVHPVTGRRSVFLSPMYAQRIVGPAGADGALLDRLNRRLDDSQVQMRWHWHAGDLVIWDETSTCHRALTDHFPMRRVMRRCVTVDR
jgi:taurine dioxygenase